MTEQPRRAAIYARISLDKSDDELGVTRQQDEARGLCEAREYVVVGTYTDNSISATNGKRRPQYLELLGAVQRAEVDVIVCYHLSRLWRNRRERAEGIDLMQRHRVSLLPVKGTEFDLSSAYGRAMAGLVGEFDTMESEVKSERQRSQIKQAADAGRAHTGGTRCYGFDRTYRVEPDRKGKPKTVAVESVNDDEAAIIEECTKRLLGGESLISVVRDLNARAVPTVKGGQWRTITLRSLMCSARISGRREHTPTDTWKGKASRPVCGEITGDGGPEIISPRDSDKLRALLTNPARRTSPREARKTMLSGLLTCSRCGRPMVSRPRAGVPRYVCTDAPGHGSCGRTAIHGERTDAEVRDRVRHALSSRELTERLARRSDAEPDLVATIRDDERELELLAEDRGTGEITRAEWKAARTPIVARIESARRRLAQATQTTALEGFVGTGTQMRERWESMNVAQRRAVVLAVVESVTVGPPTPPGNRFDPARLEVIWR
ncbi:MAG TPA: recombinase family protein [Actinomycetospora sp.]|uniref:recombinase family protein n=1 Tax=Actinomycetospora sp. TaxID=1872135 RepID=UPI002F3F8CDB